MRILIYDYDYNQITTLVNDSTINDFNSLQYSNKVNGIGDAIFIVRIDNAKINTNSVAHYNRIEITDEDGTKRWTGLIVEKTVNLNMIQVKCYSLAYILNKRVTGASVNYNGQADTSIASILSTANALEDMGITTGSISLTDNINVTYKRAKLWQAMQSIAEAVDGQILIKNDRSLDFKSVVGSNMTDSVFFRYKKRTPELTNILKFNVVDSGVDIFSKTYGVSGAYTSAQENATLKGLYGLLEEYVNFRELSNQTTLDNSTINNNKDAQLSPSIDLSPDVIDNFEAGDIVAVDIDNDFITLNGDYQIMEKNVRVSNNQKSISVKISNNVSNFVDEIKKIQSNLDLLNRQV